MLNTDHLPGISDNISGADLAAERFRANVGATARKLAPVPAEWADRFTPEQWAAYTSERFLAWHSYASMLSPEAYLNGARCADMV